VVRDTNDRALSGEFAPWAIRDNELAADMVPTDSLNWSAFAEFALSYDGYARWVRTPSLGRFANRVRATWDRTGMLPDDLESLRACLFFEQRRGHHTGVEHGDAYLDALLYAVRQHLPLSVEPPDP
jgi:hypothetical protein